MALDGDYSRKLNRKAQQLLGEEGIRQSVKLLCLWECQNNRDKAQFWLTIGHVLAFTSFCLRAPWFSSCFDRRRSSENGILED